MFKKMTLVLSLLFLAFGLTQAHAIQYVKSTENGTLQQIPVDSFDQCTRVIYRAKAKEALPLEHKKRLLSSLIRGEVVNGLDRVIQLLQTNPGTCTYGTDEEKFLTPGNATR